MFDDWIDDALLGVCYVALTPLALYSKRRIYEIIKARGLDEEELAEYYTNKIVNTRAGEFTPVVFDDIGLEE